MSSLKLFLLGQPRFERDGQPLKFDTRKNVALVAYLALTEGRHSRETLITLLWPELEPRRARAVLRRNLSVLGKALGGEWLVVDGDEIGTDPGADFYLDVDRFRHLLLTCEMHGHSDAQVCSQCLDMLAEAVELYRGDLLEGAGLRDSAAFDEWQFFQTESLREAFAAALEKLVHGHSARGEFKPAIRYARRWLALDPLHEPAHRRLMQLYARSGQHAAALRQYQECVGLLDQELSAAPDPETTDLYVRIKSSPALVLRHNLPSQSTPFIGRGPLLNEIKARIVTSDCRLLTLFGPGGSGKTRLAVEAARQILPDAQLGRFPDGVFFVPLAPLRSAEAREGEMVALLQELSGDERVHGIMVQNPMPRNINTAIVIEALDPAKDVDGAHPLNAGRLAQAAFVDQPEEIGPYFVPATPLGGLELLQRYGIVIDGRRAVIVAASNLVGKPLAMLLIRHWATATVCDLHTRPLGEMTRQADILCSATGVAHLIAADMVKPGATVLDFGFARMGSRWVGDVDFEAVREIAGAITPVPGGTGVMSNEMLMRNVLTAARRQSRFGIQHASRVVPARRKARVRVPAL